MRSMTPSDYQNILEESSLSQHMNDNRGVSKYVNFVLMTLIILISAMIAATLLPTP